MSQPAPTPVEFPEKLQFLFRPSRYKVAYGGRGGSKSWGFARALLLQGIERPLRILCAREVQKSIQDSVHKLLRDQVYAMGLAHKYEVQQAAIKGTNGTEFIFEGIRQNVGKIKSYEGVDVCWVEEAELVSKGSWDVLIPTIRKEGSEIWISFNPRLEADETYRRFVLNPPEDAVVQKINWSDNPWFPETLRREMEALKAKDRDAWLNVWEGECRTMLEGAVYAEELRDARAAGRITRVPYDATKGVSTFWDLGWSDQTSIWFGQVVGFEYRVVDFLQGRQKPLDWYLAQLQQRGYIYDTVWLPHDARARQLGTGRTIEELVRAKGWKVRVVPRMGLADGINAARTVFAQCWFDEARCAEGLKALAHYRYELVGDGGNNPELQHFTRQPVHDQYSHAADAFRYMAMGLRAPRSRSAEVLAGLAKKVLDLGEAPSYQGQGWLR